MKRNKTHIFVLALVSCGFSFAAEEMVESISKKPTFGATSHFLASESKDALNASSNTEEFYRHEATVSTEYGAFDAKAGFTSRYTPDGTQGQNTAFTLEKKTVSYSGENLNVKLGDSYQELGRGIALSLYRDAVFGIDNTLEGGSVKATSKTGEVGFFGGRLNVWKVPVAINPVDQRMKGKNAYLASGFGAVNLTSDAKVGAHYLLTQTENISENRFELRQQTVGAFVNVANIGDSVDLYAEGNVMDAEDYSISGTRPRGYGSYGSLSWSPPSWKIKAEAKDYRKFAYDFRRPPTLEEDNILSLNVEDVTATRLYGERFLGGPQNSVLSSFLAGYDREENTQVYHPLVGGKAQLLDGVDSEVKVGYRWMTGKNNLAHAALKNKIKTGKGQFFELELRKQVSNYGLNTTIPIQEDRNIVLATYTFNERWSGGIGYEHIPSNDSDTGNHFMNFSGNYKNGAFNGRTLIGQTSGGTQCSGGVCRQVLPFTGAYLETTYSF